LASAAASASDRPTHDEFVQHLWELCWWLCRHGLWTTLQLHSHTFHWYLLIPCLWD